MIPLYDSQPAKRFPYWTILIILANIFVFYLQITSSAPEQLIQNFVLIPSLVNFSNPFTLIPFFTSQFLHGGFLHIISNMLFLWVFGDNVEGELGWFGFPVLYLLSGFIGGVAQYIFMTSSNIPMLGASGAVAGVLGAYYAWFPHHSIKTLVPVLGFVSLMNIPASFILFYWIATQFLAGAFSFSAGMQNVGGVAYFAHIGGFIIGYILAKLIPRTDNKIQVIQPD